VRTGHVCRSMDSNVSSRQEERTADNQPASFSHDFDLGVTSAAQAAILASVHSEEDSEASLLRRRSMLASLR
jgi:hypothetical protein